MAIGGPLIGRFGLSVIAARLNYVCSARIASLKNPYDFIKRFHVMMDLIQRDKKRMFRIINPIDQNDIFLAGSIERHRETCIDAVCFCKTFVEGKSQQTNVLLDWKGTVLQVFSSSSRLTGNSYQDDEFLKKFINKMFQEGLEYRDFPLLHITYGIFQAKMFDNLLGAYSNFRKAVEMKGVALRIEFYVYLGK